MDDASADLMVEAALLASRRPLSEERLREVAPAGYDVQTGLARIAAFWADRSVRLSRDGSGWSFAVAPGILPPPRASRTRDLSEGAIATLAVVALHQPVTIARISEIRRTKISRAMVSDLESAGLVAGRRRDRGSGKAVEYLVTERFLEEVGVESLLDFPTADEAVALAFSWDRS